MAKIKPFYTPSPNTQLLKYYTKQIAPAAPARDGVKETADLISKNYIHGKDMTPYQKPKKIDRTAATPTTAPTTSQADPLSTYEAEKKSEVQRLAADKEAAEQAAWVSYQKLLKYMPTQNKANGLYGQGLSESGALQAQAAYASRQGDIDMQYQGSMSDLERYYSSKKENYLANLYEQAKADIGNRPYATAKELQEYVKQHYGHLRDDQVASLMSLAEANSENISRANEESARNRIANSYVNSIEQYIAESDYGNAKAALEKAQKGKYITDEEYKYYADLIQSKYAFVSPARYEYYDGLVPVGNDTGMQDVINSSYFQNWLVMNNYKKDYSNIPDGTTFFVKSDDGEDEYILFIGGRPSLAREK